MPDSAKYFIDKVVSTAERFCKNDIDEYEQLINVFFTNRKIQTERDLKLFSEVFSNSSLPGHLSVKYDKASDSFSVKMILDDNDQESDIYPVIRGGSRVSIAVSIVQAVLKNNQGLKAGKPVQSFVEPLKSYLDNDDIFSALFMCINELTEEEIEEGYKDKVNQTYYFLLKSLMVGEYVILSDYSQKLDKIKKLHIETTSSFLNSFLLSLQNSCLFVESACSTLRSSFEDKQIQYTTIVGGVWGHHKHSEYDKNVDFYVAWRDVVEALVNVILIDFIFVSTPGNIDTLHWALRVLERFSVKEMKPVLADQVNDEIRVPLLDKIYVMLRQMIMNKTSDSSELPLQSSIIFGETGIEEEINQRRIGNSEAYCCDFDEIGCFRTDYQFEKMGDFWDYLNTPYTDVNKMNRFLKKNYEIRKGFHPVLDEMAADKPSAFDKLENYSEEKLSQLTVSFLYDAIHYVSRFSVNEDDAQKLRRKGELMSTLLNRLDTLVDSYSSCRIVPRKFGYPFTMDYYKSDNNVLTPLAIDRNELSDTVTSFSGTPIIFFYSAGLKPVHISFLRRFISSKRRENIPLLEKALLDSNRVEMKKIKEDFEERFRDQSSSNIKLLGFLGSFIAFVSAGVHSLNTDFGVENFTTLLKAVVSCILAFVVMLNFITLPKDEEIEKYSKSYTASLFFAMIIVIVLVFL